MAFDKVMMTSNTDEWYTPHDFFKKYNDQYGFTLDVCATAENAKCERFFDRQIDGLSQEWAGVCWMNPPYGRTIGLWVKKAYEESLKGCLVVCLLPARTDTRWWHDYCVMGKITFIKGRLKFGGCRSSAPFPSAVVIFNSKEV